MDIFTYTFFQHALVASLLASLVCGMVGVIVVEKKMMMMTGGIAHTSYGGIGLGYLLGFHPMLGAFLMALVASVGMAYIKRRGGTHRDVVIALFWSLGMALGILFIGMMPGYPPDMSSYLFGSILSVTRQDLTLMAGLTLLVSALIFSFFNAWKAYLFDEEFVRISGLKTPVFDYLLLLIIAMSVVVLIRVVGIILILALFTAPSAISQFYQRHLGGRMILSMVLGTVFSILGLILSYLLDVASGALIVCIAAFSYFIVYAVKNRQKKISPGQAPSAEGK